MHFDDRLGTVLRQRIGGAVMARIQYRQLLDLLGTLPAEAHGPQVESAYDRLSELSASLSAADQTQIIAESNHRLRSPRLIAALAGGAPQVAGAVIQEAQLDEEQWLDLAPALPIQARSHMRDRRDLGPAVDAIMARLGIMPRGLPPSDAGHSVINQAADSAEIGGIGAIVRRIEDFRKSRKIIEPAITPQDAPQLPLGDVAGPDQRSAFQSFDFCSDAAGQIIWADGAVAPLVYGLSLSGSAIGASPSFADAMRNHQPLQAEYLTLTGATAIAGRWRIDAAPRFDPLTGGFAGFSGRLRRPAPVRAASISPQSAEADRMRQMLHELRTPVNAIQGFAEVIQQQLFGHTPHDYRALAASIAGDAARILAGFEDMERLARLDSGAMELDEGTCDLAALLAAQIAQLQAYAQQRNCALFLDAQPQTIPVKLAKSEAERLVWRLLATIAGASAPGEELTVKLWQDSGFATILCTLPTSLATREGEELFRSAASTSSQALSGGMFGAGFALRLLRAELRAAGGALERRGESLALTLPDLTASPMHHSEVTASGNSA